MFSSYGASLNYFGFSINISLLRSSFAFIFNFSIDIALLRSYMDWVFIPINIALLRSYMDWVFYSSINIALLRSSFTLVLGIMGIYYKPQFRKLFLKSCLILF
jgi:hypothetical protein